MSFGDFSGGGFGDFSKYLDKSLMGFEDEGDMAQGDMTQYNDNGYDSGFGNFDYGGNENFNIQKSAKDNAILNKRRKLYKITTERQNRLDSGEAALNAEEMSNHTQGKNYFGGSYF